MWEGGKDYVLIPPFLYLSLIISDIYLYINSSMLTYPTMFADDSILIEVVKILMSISGVLQVSYGF